MTAAALDLDGVLGDTHALWREWLVDAARRLRVDGLDALADDRVRAADVLDARVGNWRALLERYAEEHAPVHLRPRPEVGAALRRLQAAGVRIGVFTDAPEPLARVALAQLGAARRVEAVETGAGALERLLERLGPGTVIVRSAVELAGTAA